MDAPDPATEAVLAGGIARAEAACSAVRLEHEAFAAYVGARMASVEPLGDARFEDLWVACGAFFGDPHALAHIEAHYFGDARIALRKMFLADDAVDEVLQGLRRLLFVGEESAPPRIGEYRGIGELRAWLKVSAMRAALKLLRRQNRASQGDSDDALVAARATEDDPELAYMKAAYRAAFKVAFQQALDSLLPKERLLLKQQIVDGLGVDELGAVYQVHRATAARWAASAREKLLARTRRTFMLQARVSSDECESIMRLVRSQLDVSIRRRLASGA